MTDSIKAILIQTKLYIEEMEETADGEWGKSRSLDELIKQGAMPSLYGRVLNALKNKPGARNSGAG